MEIAAMVRRAVISGVLGARGVVLCLGGVRVHDRIQKPGFGVGHLRNRHHGHRQNKKQPNASRSHVRVCLSTPEYRPVNHYLSQKLATNVKKRSQSSAILLKS